jgi:hypothetical protein
MYLKRNGKMPPNGIRPGRSGKKQRMSHEVGIDPNSEQQLFSIEVHASM